MAIEAINPLPLVELIKQTVEIFKSVKNKLVNQPEEANGKLEAVFEELTKIFLAFDTEITNFQSLTFDKGSHFKEERKLLYKLEGIELQYSLNVARGHCGKIKNIYEKYLRKWLSQVLDPGEFSNMELLFINMEHIDTGMLVAIEQIGSWLNTKAKELLDLLDEDKLEEIDRKMDEYRKEIRPIRARLSQTTNDLHLLVNELANTTGVV